ncbi:MAG: ubiquinone/menaquinone biosynthesis methyltransferase [bacterium]
MNSPPKDPERIRSMFDRIAPRYDLLNRVLSLGSDQRWRRTAARRVEDEAPAGPVLDLACGTGDLLRELHRRGGRPRTRLGADSSRDMLMRARSKLIGSGHPPLLVRADGRSLPFPDGSLAGVTIAFGIRNFPDLGRGLAEMARVTGEDGVVGVLEFTRDRDRWMDLLYRPWARLVIPRLGRLLSGEAGAYTYLPASVEAYASSGEMRQAIERAGFRSVEERSFSGGVCRLFLARKGPSQPRR